MKSTSVRLDEEAHQKLKELSDRSGISATKLIAIAVIRFCEQAKKEGTIEVPVDPE